MKIVDKIRNKMGQNPESEEYIEEVDNTDDSDLQATTYQNPDNVVDFTPNKKVISLLIEFLIEYPKAKRSCCDTEKFKCIND